MNNDNNKNSKVRNTKKNNNSRKEDSLQRKTRNKIARNSKGKTYRFLNLKTYEDQAYQFNLSQKNKSNECINSAQIHGKVTDVT